MRLKQLVIIAILVMSGAAEAQTCDADRMLASARWYMDQVYDIEAMQIEVDPADLCRQSELDSLSGFNAAFERALDRIFFDARHPESPLALMKAAMRERWSPENGDVPFEDLPEAARYELRDLVNRPTTVLTLMPLGSRDANGDSVVYNWIFKLKIPEFSDHVFFIVQDRTEEERPYIYGVN